MWEINQYGIHVKHFFKALDHKYTRFSAWLAAKQDDAIRKLEKDYATIHKAGRVERDVLLSATRNTIKAHLYIPDVYAIVLGLSIISWTTGAFSENGYEYGPWQPVVIMLAGMLAGIIPLILVTFLVPLHIIYRISIWILTAVNVVLSAVIFAAVEPVIPMLFYDGGILYFDDLIWKIMVYYTVSLFFIHMRMRDKVCFKCYIKRQNQDCIQNHIPADKRGGLVALSAQDHYVKIITTNGEHLARLSMKDAVSLASETEGLRVHRSHWVAKSQILSLEKRAERYFLSLRNGTQVPVSKAQVPAIRPLLEAL